MSGKNLNGERPGGEGAEEEELVIVGDGADTDGQEPEVEARREIEGDDEEAERRAAAGEGDGDERLGGSEDLEDRGERDGRQQRRLSRAEKNERRRRAQERDRTELRFLRTRNEQLERQASETAARLDRLEQAGEDERLSRLRGAIRQADQTIVRLTAAGEEAQAIEATQIRNNLQDQLQRETDRRATARATTERRAPAETEERGGDEGGMRLSNETRRNIADWQARNPWFDADNPGTDERVVHALDASILGEGFDPNDPEYYRELDRRIAEYLPHRASRRSRDDDGFDDRDRGRSARRDDRDDRDDRDSRRPNDRDRRPRGPTFRVGGRDRQLRPNEVFLSAERKEALEQMGALEDPVLRARYLKAYKKYDDEHANDRRRR